MNRIDLENVLRPMLYNLSVVGKRGPVSGYVLPAMIFVVVILVLLLITLIKIYESISTGKCICCGRSNHDKVHVNP